MAGEISALTTTHRATRLLQHTAFTPLALGALIRGYKSQIGYITPSRHLLKSIRLRDCEIRNLNDPEHRNVNILCKIILFGTFSSSQFCIS